MEAVLAEALQLADPAGPAVIMTRCEPDGGALTLVIGTATGRDIDVVLPGDADSGARAGINYSWTDLAEQQLLEITWKCPAPARVS